MNAKAAKIFKCVEKKVYYLVAEFKSFGALVQVFSIYFFRQSLFCFFIFFVRCGFHSLSTTIKKHLKIHKPDSKQKPYTRANIYSTAAAQNKLF